MDKRKLQLLVGASVSDLYRSYIGSLTTSQAFSHPGNSILEWTQIKLPNVGETTIIYFRYVDASNYMDIRIADGGNFQLVKTIAGTTTGLQNALGVVVS